MKKNFLTICALFLLFNIGFAQITKPKPPVMGWSSWNNFKININEELIKKQADAMAKNGMKAAGYTYINIDDGFFGGRDAEGTLLYNKKKFPNGMKAIADYIHSKGLKAGIYSDAGLNTCASLWDKDSIESGVGLYGHDAHDLQLMLHDWGYDFIKIDWCGGEKLQLNEEARYTAIGKLVKQIKPDAVFNICRWTFPGEWATLVADSWRISGDIENTFASVMHIVDLNADLWNHCTPGHYNDMDMLQVGRGMSYEEDKTHFSMWCMMNSPLLAGNDLENMSQQTLDILTNKELIALNQDALAYQARKIEDLGDIEIWAKPLVHTMSGNVAVALLNRSEATAKISIDVEKLGLNASKGYTMRDLWNKKNYSNSFDLKQSFSVAPHGIVVLRLKGTTKPFNIFQSAK